MYCTKICDEPDKYGCKIKKPPKHKLRRSNDYFRNGFFERGGPKISAHITALRNSCERVPFVSVRWLADLRSAASDTLALLVAADCSA